MTFHEYFLGVIILMLIVSIASTEDSNIVSEKIIKSSSSDRLRDQSQFKSN